MWKQSLQNLLVKALQNWMISQDRTLETNQILLKTICVGIDGTDREIDEGTYGTSPKNSDYLVFGHEALAKVEAIGDRVEGFSEGELVVPTVRRSCDENCLNCKKGETDMCLTGNYYEHGIYRLHGFASEYAVSDANFLVQVPKELGEVAILLEPLSIVEKALSQAFRIQRRMVWEPTKVFVAGAGSLGLLAAMVLRSKGLEVYVVATRTKESLKAQIVISVGGCYVNVRETPISNLREKFDIVVEATGRVDVALESLNLMGSNNVLCVLGIYREMKACQEFGEVLTKMVLGKRLIFGSVSSNKTHFEMGIKDIKAIRTQYGDILNRLITERLKPEEFKQAFKPEGEDIKTMIHFN